MWQPDHVSDYEAYPDNETPVSVGVLAAPGIDTLLSSHTAMGYEEFVEAAAEMEEADQREKLVTGHRRQGCQASFLRKFEISCATMPENAKPAYLRKGQLKTRFTSKS